MVNRGEPETLLSDASVSQIAAGGLCSAAIVGGKVQTWFALQHSCTLTLAGEHLKRSQASILTSHAALRALQAPQQAEMFMFGDENSRSVEATLVWCLFCFSLSEIRAWYRTIFS
jgi:hypothetical protein